MTRPTETTARLLQELNRRAKAGEYLRFVPYASQKKVIMSDKMILALFGGNQGGKSFAGRHKVAYDATGRYPDWWTGPRTTRAVDIWVIGETNGTTRDILQAGLFGPDATNPGEGGTIPSDLIPRKPVMRSNMPGAIDTIWVDHVSGGRSQITFKSYEQGRKVLASWTGDLVWVDEEPPWDCFEELVMRVLKKRGQILMTFTPLLGYTKLVNMLMGKKMESLDAIKNMPIERDFLGWDQAAHLDSATKDSVKMLFAGNPGQLQARMTGMPTVSQGLVFPYDTSQLWIPPFTIDKSWPRIGGLDVGWRHETAAIVGALDPGSDTLYFYDEYGMAEKPVSFHVAMLRKWGDVDFQIDPSSRQTEKGTGEKLIEMYLDEWHGEGEWERLPEHFRKFQIANNKILPSINEITQRIMTERIFFFEGLRRTREQFETWCWDETGERPVDIEDDRIDPVRYATMGAAAGKARMMGRRMPMDPALAGAAMMDRMEASSLVVPTWKAARRGY